MIDYCICEFCVDLNGKGGGVGVENMLFCKMLFGICFLKKILICVCVCLD